MDYLWSPWRYRYVQTTRQDDACIFCAKAADGHDEENLIVHRAKYNFVLLNLFPYNSGHVMIAPYEHVATLEAAPEETTAEMMHLTRQLLVHLRAIYNPAGFNFGMNIGEAAGAGVAGHIHMHVLPRWPGDANFMTTVAETRVLPEDLSETYRKLRAAFELKCDHA
jgi:ATP adenylyltransferase